MEFYSSIDKDADKKIVKTIKTRTHFVSCAYFCTLAVDSELSQREINFALMDFFSGSPSKSDEYNKTVGAGSAKPMAVQTRQRIIRRLFNNLMEG